VPPRPDLVVSGVAPEAGARDLPADIAVGGVVVRLAGLPPALAAVVRRRYAAFALPAGGHAAVEIEVAVDGPADVPESVIDETLDVERSCEVERQGGLVAVRGPRFEGTLDPATRRGRLVTQPALGPLDAMLRAALSLALVDHDGVVVHAAGVARGGRGFVFAGPSGAGKTTIGRALSGWQAGAPTEANGPGGDVLLADELVVLRLDGAGVVAAGTPFWTGAAVAAPLAGLFLLERGGVAGVRLLEPARGVPALWRELGRYLPVPDLERRCFAILGEILRRVPLRGLTLPEDLPGVRANAEALLASAGLTVSGDPGTAGGGPAGARP
jgi:hypothetical protein